MRPGSHAALEDGTGPPSVLGAPTHQVAQRSGQARGDPGDGPGADPGCQEAGLPRLTFSQEHTSLELGGERSMGLSLGAEPSLWAPPSAPRAQ